MLLAIDIGNTITTLGVFEGDNLRHTWNIATEVNRTEDEYAVMILNLLRNRGLDESVIKEVTMCSVVPPLQATFEKLFRRYFGRAPLVVEAGIKTGVRIHADNPKEVGADRIVNTAAAHRLYGGPAIVVDLGTATTFDVVSKSGDYLGGVIAPGIITAAEALFLRAAKLPRVELVRPRTVIGTSTVTAMQSGVVFGYVGLVEGIISRLQQELGEKAKIIATGGCAELIAKETPVIDTVNADLTLIGLRLVYLLNKED
ncbi:type III pantothenate kinase [Chloroflexota bacterium]